VIRQVVLLVGVKGGRDVASVVWKQNIQMGRTTREMVRVWTGANVTFKRADGLDQQGGEV
jgi:hypothetical protein